MTKFSIVECSPEARKKIAVDAKDVVGTSVNEHHRVKYPFSQLKIGECFTVSIDQASEPSLRVLATREGKKESKKFTVIKHDNYACFEVARIA